MATKTLPEDTETKNTSGRKLIRRVSLEMETLDFDAAYANVQKTVNACGGYFESSNINGNSAYGNGRRYGEFVVRIPTEHLDEFLAQASNMGNILYRSENTEDITLQYIDTESRIEALTLQQEKLMELLEAAKKMEDILSIERELTDIRYELEFYASTKLQYDNLVDYSTVNMYIDEVISEGGQDFVVWFISSLPYFMIIAIVAVIVILIIKKIWRRK